MSKFNWRKLIPHIVAVVLFLLIAVVYCQPELNGKTVSGSDLTLWKATVHSMEVYKDTHGHFPLWTNSMFSGMPGFMVAMDSQNPIPIYLFNSITILFLPKPIAFFFLMCASFYFLALALRIKPWVGIVGALGYAYASFSAVLVLAGHETELFAMGYAPFVLGALVLIFEGKYWWGAALTALAAYLLISVNHVQIAFYTGIMAVFMTLSYVIRWVKAKEYKRLVVSLALALFAGGVGILANAGALLTNYDYSKATLRNGGLSLDTTTGKMEKSKGLDINYAFQYSYGYAESFTLVTPNVVGGASEDPLPQDGKLADAISQNQLEGQAAQQMYMAFPAYWGDQPIVSGPVYLGAVMVMLFIFSLFYLKNKQKWWLVSVSVLALLMAWGKNFGAFNDFLFYHLPMYNKFRAPTMALVILQLAFPLLAALSLQQLLYGGDDKAYIFQQFKKSMIATGALLVVLVGMYMTLSYQSPNDRRIEDYLTQVKKGDPSLGRSLVKGAEADRQGLFGSDLGRTFIFIVLGAGVLFLYVKGKVKAGVALAGLGLLSFVDQISVDTRYLNYDLFKDPDENAAAFNPTPADQQINQDTSYYRVFNTTVRDMTGDGITPYFHNSLGGYNAAKLALYQDLIIHQMSKEPANMAVFNMLNTKYFIVANRQTNQLQAETNPGALGPCWLVSAISYVDGPAAAMKALDKFNPKDTAVVEEAFKGSIPFPVQHDSTGYVRLIHNDNDVITYESSSNSNEFAIFSEIYYDRGWKAYIDGKEAPIVKTDYLLRGLALPAGKHSIRFEFKPKAYFAGQQYSTIGSALIILLLLGAAFQEYKATRQKA